MFNRAVYFDYTWRLEVKSCFIICFSQCFIEKRNYSAAASWLAQADRLPVISSEVHVTSSRSSTVSLWSHSELLLSFENFHKWINSFRPLNFSKQKMWLIQREELNFQPNNWDFNEVILLPKCACHPPSAGNSRAQQFRVWDLTICLMYVMLCFTIRNYLSSCGYCFQEQTVQTEVANLLRQYRQYL